MIVKKEKIKSSGNGQRLTKDQAVKIEISAGKLSRIAPNFILGALVEATGMQGKSFGKIDILVNNAGVQYQQNFNYGSEFYYRLTEEKIRGQNCKLAELEKVNIEPENILMLLKKHF